MSKAFDFARSIEGSGSFDGLALPSSTSSTAGVPGEIRNNNGVIERWSSTDFVPQWRPIDEDAQPNPYVHFLVIGGGGAGGGTGQAGGGGAGGYRTSWGTGNVSGGLTPVETPITPNLGTAYTITVGAGGAGVANSIGNKGSDSIFATITSEGGGPGSPHGKNSLDHSGGSGGGTGTNHGGSPSVAGTTGQGFDGGYGQGTTGSPSGYGDYYNGAGGGGAGGPGANGLSYQPGDSVGGVGLASDITGTSIFRAGGGAGGHGYAAHSGHAYAAGGNGGGGSAQSGTGNNGTANTGGGGAGAAHYSASYAGGNGGSGVIILRTVGGLVARFTAGVTVNGTTVSVDNTVVNGTSVGSELIWIITQASSDTITFATS